MAWDEKPPEPSEINTQVSWDSAPPEVTESKFKSFVKKFGSMLSKGYFPNIPKLETIQGIVENPRGSTLKAAEMLPAAGSIALPVAGAATTGGSGVLAATGLAGLGAGAGEAARQGIRRLLGEKEPANPIPIPFTNKTIPRIPGLSPEASNIATEGIVGAATELIPRGIGAAAPKLQKTTNKIREWITGKDSHKFAKIAEDPNILLPEFMGGPKSMSKVSGEYADALGASEMSKSLSPAINHEKTMIDAWDVISKDIPEKHLSDQDTIKAAVRQLEPQEAFAAWESTKQVLKGMVKGKDKQLFRNRVIFKNALQDHLIEISPAFGDAVKDYAKSALRSEMTDLLPTTKYGVPSIGRSGFAGVVAKMLGLPFGITSPVVQTGTAVIEKAVTKAASDPNAVRGIMALFRKKKAEEKK